MSAKPGCGSRPNRACLAVGNLGLVELPLEAMDLALPVRSMPESPLVQYSLRELLGDPPRFLERVTPGAGERHDLGPMHEAEALVRDHVRLLLAPARQRLRPLARAPKLVHVTAERDRVAVDDAGDNRRELTRRDGHHGLVHEPHAVLGPSLPDERVALLHQRERHEVLVAEPLADLRDLRGARVRRRRSRPGRVLEKRRDQEIAALDAVGILALEQPLAAREPSARRGRLTEEEEVVADPPRAARRPQGISGIRYA